MRTTVLVWLIGMLIGIASLLRFWQLDKVPYGFHVDEYATAVSMKCLATEGTGPWGQKNPFFMHLGYGQPKPPIYNWMALAWVKVGGFSPEGFRLFSTIMMTVGVVGIFFLARIIGGTMCGWWAMLAAAISPWVWVTGRLAYESLFAPVFFTWGLYFFWRRKSWMDFIAAGLLMSGAMYLYPVARLFVPMFIPVLIIFSWPWKIKKSSYGIWLGALVLSMIPLAQGVLSGELQTRFNEISIASPKYLASVGVPHTFAGIFGEFIKNYAMHLSPMFLFIKGGPTLVHSTEHFGIFSWLDCLALALLIILPLLKHRLWKEQWPLLTLCLVSFLFGLIPSSLTNIEIPNSLRSSMGWPLMCVLVGFTIAYAAQRIKYIDWLALALTVLFMGCFLKVYFNDYPLEGRGMFTFWVREQASQLKSDDDWLKFMVINHQLDYHIRYYLMNMKNQSCSESFKTWKAVGEIIEKANLR